MKQNNLLFSIILGAAFGTQAHAQLCEATLEWVAPTDNTDDTPLTDLAAFRIYHGPAVDDLPNVIQVDDPAETTHVAMMLDEGTTFFAITALNVPGAESDFSNVVPMTWAPGACDPMPDPRPPTGVAVAVIVAYQYLPQTDRAVMLPVGEIAAGTTCDPAEGIVAEGQVYFAVPSVDVNWYGTVEPAAVYAICD